MTNVEQQFLYILKNAVHPASSFAIDNPDWMGIMSAARKQNLFALIFDTSQGLPSYDEVEEKYFASVAVQMSNQMQKTADFLQLYKAFISEGLLPIVLKGIICRNLYGDRADFRASGDEDVLVAKKDFQKAVEVLNRCGYKTDEITDKELNLVQEITFHNPESPLTIELHLNPLGRANDLLSEMNDWFRDVFTRTEYVEILDTQIRIMHPTDEFLFLTLHMFKHFTSTGAGIRMAMDVLLYMEKYYDRIDWTYIWDKLEQVRADSYLIDLIAVGNQYLGFNLPLERTPTSPEALIEDMLKTGIFGSVTENASETSRYTNMAITNGRSSKVTAIWHMIFPSWKMWASWRPYLKDKLYMLPIEWFKRVGRFIKSGKKVAVMTESYDVASERIELLRKYKII